MSTPKRLIIPHFNFEWRDGFINWEILSPGLMVDLSSIQLGVPILKELRT
jgi:hypothetical protein